MNRLRKSIILCLLFLVSPSMHGIAHSFTTPEEYLSHAKGSDSCITQQCHAALAKKDLEDMHDPFANGECDLCHSAESYPNKYGISQSQRAMCSECHKSLELEIQSSAFIHGPILNDDCISCHDPHESDELFLLRKSYSELCSTCHKPARLYAGKVLHKPVTDGNCSLCHDPHASNIKYRLTDVGANLCITCHAAMMEGMTQDHVHAPLVESGCTECHDPHAGKNTLRLKRDADKICFTCHEAKKKEIEQYAQKHEPAQKGQCTHCHSPHYSENKNLLRDRLDTLCYQCHKESRVWIERRFLHGPVVQGNCSACHNPHGSDNAFILKLPFPDKFYTEYKLGKYDLCFLCHKEALVTTEKTKTITNFRNGDINLHRVHVHQKKGRSCRACHDVHASDQEGRIRNEFPFGKMKIQLEYSKTKTGGSCQAGCHKERSYDRVKQVKNER